MSILSLIFLQAGTTAPAPGGFGQYQSFIMIGLMIVVFYFFMIRPQQKKAKDQKNFKNTLQKGDKIVTIGGIHGKIAEIKENTFVIDIGNGVKHTIEKSAISMDITKAVQGEKPTPNTPAIAEN